MHPGGGEIVYTFHVRQPDQVDELRELWAEQVIDWDRAEGTVRVKAHPQTIDEFLMFYDLLEYLESEEPSTAGTGHDKPASTAAKIQHVG
jgi:hypothetical protein